MIKLSKKDVVFISYKEPNAEENWKHLKSYVPKAKRVHGVEGFDAAHKEAASIVSTPRFITVDGDNYVNPKFFTQDIYFPEDKFENDVFSWSSRNSVNGLIYGNGGIKSWNTESVKKMKTHENSENLENKVDFCWFFTYLQSNSCWSDTIINKTPEQAYRAGLREGVKLALVNGKKIEKRNFKDEINKNNFKRLQIYFNIGTDVENGIHAIEGARKATYDLYTSEWDYSKINDYSSYHVPDAYTIYENDKINYFLGSLGFMIVNMSHEQSKFYKNFPLSTNRFDLNIKTHFWDEIKYQLENWYGRSDEGINEYKFGP